MKKLLSMLLSLILALGVCLAFASCGTPDPEDDGGNDECTSHVDSDGDGVCDTEGCGAAVTPSPAPSGDYFNENGELILYKGGVPTFKLVKGTDIGSVAVDVDALATTLSKLSAKAVEVVDSSSEAQAVEILIGTVTTRGDEYKISKYSLGEKGYMVKQVGTKIIVQAGSSAALTTAFKYLKEDVFGIRKTNDNFTDFVMAAAKNLEAPQDDYAVKSVKIDGKNLKDYTIYYNNTSAKSVATDFRNELYSKVGIYLELTNKAVAAGTPTVQFNVIENTGVGNGYEVKVEDDGDLVFNCEFEYLFEELATTFYKDNITEAKRSKVTFDKGVLATEDIRNIYYEDFGATGDGVTNDFAAIRDAHALANEHGHTVNGTAGATYYIGSTGGESAVIMTDVKWNGCKFIFDDSGIKVHDASTCPFGTSTSKCKECADRLAAVFAVYSSQPSKNVASLFAQFTKNNPLKGGWKESDNTTVIPGWNLEYDAWVSISTRDRKVFIRQGANTDSGDHMGEWILVHPDGTIDESTPLSWDYDSITWATAYNVDEKYDKPITIDGGGALITTIVNEPGTDVKNGYNAFSRNIAITRSNVTLKNFDHRNEETYIYRAPYAGILHASRCSNVTYENITLEKHNGKYDGTVTQGTYEIGGYGANDLKYINVKVINFFCDDDPLDFKDGAGTTHTPGEISYRGCMGTNYCRNFYFEDCRLNSFDAHKGLGNLTIKDSTFEHINLLGSGNVLVEDTVIYADGARTILNLREDYGSTWRGDITIRNVQMRFCKNFKANNAANELMVINTNKYLPDADYDSVYNPKTNEYVADGNFINYLPANITIENVTLVRYTYTSYDKETDTIDEQEISAEGYRIYLFNPSVHTYTSADISKDFSHKLIASETITVNNCPDDLIVIPATPQFEDTVYTLDGAIVPLS